MSVMTTDQAEQAAVQALAQAADLLGLAKSYLEHASTSDTSVAIDYVESADHYGRKVRVLRDELQEDLSDV